MEKVKIGVLGAGRGKSMISYCEAAENAEVVAVCDNYPVILEKTRAEINDSKIAYYDDFEKFIKHDMDAVVLANYATEHAPFAIRCLEEGKHVFSEVLPCHNLKQGIELIEAAEMHPELVYAYGENYCYMPAPYEMRRLYRAGKLGEFEYGEGEYMHNCESIWPEITQGNPDHWRNHLFTTFYCTHSIGPLLHITGLRPVKVSAFETPFNARLARMGLKSGCHGIEIVTLENGAIIKSIHGYLDKNSIWFSVYGTMGRLESAREDEERGDVSRIYVNLDKKEGEENNQVVSYKPQDELTAKAEKYGHGGSDYYTMYNFVEKIRKNPEADTIDVYEAMDMYLPGLLGYRSILNGGIPVEIPDLRDKKVREKYRNDTMCTDPKVAGDMLVPSYSKGNPDIPMETYERIEKMWKAMLK